MLLVMLQPKRFMDKKFAPSSLINDEMFTFPLLSWDFFNDEKFTFVISLLLARQSVIF